MPIRLTTADLPVDPVMHGVLATIVSTVLGIAAHGFGGGFDGHGLSTAHVVVLAALAVVVGVVRAGQVRAVERRRSQGRLAVGWSGTAAALVGGQVTAHGALTMLGHGAHGGWSALLPDTGMLAWHVLALPAAVAVLVVAERLARVCQSRITVIQRLAVGFGSADEPARAPVVGCAVHARSILRSTAAGIRGPPAMV
ncbi:hypothetical protein [Gordonia zhaorongruii]|uniref:hypothetical protein n=1 Tax=Gordonia zhaorongruii TaxID=2597659 RepID=UPI001180E53B|nr:hypothetical protein [Gordonia zhaorongruii]